MKTEMAGTVINFVGAFIFTALVFATMAVAGRLCYEVLRDWVWRK